MEKKRQNQILQREVMIAAIDADPAKRVVDARHAPAAQLLAQRGYIVLHPHEDGFQVELSDLAMRYAGLRTGSFWRRYPPLPCSGWKK